MYLYFMNSTQVSEANLKLWWDEFMSEFFHENATLAIEVDLGDGMRKFCKLSYNQCGNLSPVVSKLNYLVLHI